MGSTLKPDVFNDRLTKFLTDGNWSRYAAYAPLNRMTPDECLSATGRPSNPNKTSFSCLVARIDRVPSANILITDAQTGSEHRPDAKCLLHWRTPGATDRTRGAFGPVQSIRFLGTERGSRHRGAVLALTAGHCAPRAMLRRA